MNPKRLIVLFALLSSFAVSLIGAGCLLTYFHSIGRNEGDLGLALVTFGWFFCATWIGRRVSSWCSSRRGWASPSVGAAQPREYMNIRCAVCDCEVFTVSHRHDYCAIIKCAHCSTMYKYGPGIMERIL